MGRYLAVETDSASSVPSLGVEAGPPVVHLGVVVTVKRVSVTVAFWEQHTHRHTVRLHSGEQHTHRHTVRLHIR